MPKHASSGEQGGHEAHDAKNNGGGSRGHHGAVDGVAPGQNVDRCGGDDLG